MFVTCWGPYDASGLHNCIKVAADFDLRYLDYGLPFLALGPVGKTTIECGLFISCLFVCSFCCNGLIFGLQTTQQPPSITLLSKATRCMKRRSRSLEPRAPLAPTGWGPPLTRPTFTQSTLPHPTTITCPCILWTNAMPMHWQCKGNAMTIQCQCNANVMW